MQPSDAPYTPLPPPRGISGAMKILAAIIIGSLVFAGAYFAVKEQEKRARERQAMEELEKSRRELGSEMQQELEKNGTISTESATKAMDKMRGQLDKITAQGGSNNREMKAATAVLAEVQKKTVPYMELIKRIETDNPMDMSTVKDKADLAERRKFGQEMLRLNGDILSFLDSVEPLLREKLTQTGAAGGSTEEFVKGFMKGFGKSATIQRKIRKTDDTIAKSLIAVTNLMEEEWGKWKAVNGKISFDNDAKAKRFNELMDDTVKASDEQTAAQREFLELQQRK